MMAKKKGYTLKVKELSGVKKELDVTVPADVVKEEVKAVYRSVQNSAALPGFRKGAVPKGVLKARFGDQIQEDVATRLIEGSYGPAIQESGFAPLGAPDIDVKTRDVESGDDFKYTAAIEINPVIDVKGYRGMEIAEENIEVSDKDVEEGLKRLARARGQYKEVDRAAKAEDLVTVDFEATVEGKVLDKGRMKDFHVIIGQVTPFPGMDEAIVGASKGDKVETDLDVPANYSEGDVAGKKAHVKVKVKAVKELTIPEIDDEFAKDIECEGLDDLKGRIERDLSRVREENERERLKNLALANLIDAHEIEVPESLEKKYLSMIVSRALDNMRAGKPAPGDANLSIDQLREKYRPIAVRSVKEDVILDSIAQAEGIEVTTEELTEAVRHLADARQVSFDELMKRIEREGALEVIRDGIKHEKVFDIIFEHSTGAKNWVRKTGEKAEPEKKAAGKTGAKAKPKAKPKAKAAEKGPGDKKKGGDE